MAEVNPEESFTFVDKRKVGSEAEHNGAEAEGQAIDSQTTGESVQQSGADILDDSLGLGEDEIADPLGSYGLAAYVTGLIASDAWQKMGLIADPMTGKVEKNMEQARFSIDCVSALIGVIEQHQSGVPAELRRDLQRVLSDLRLNFVEQQSRS